MTNFEKRILNLRNAGKTWKEIRKSLQTEMDGNGTKRQMLDDIEDMDGKTLKKIPKEELRAVFAEVIGSNGTKPKDVRDAVWERGIYCTRQEINSFKALLARNPDAVDSCDGRVEKMHSESEDSFPIADFRVLSGLIARHGRDKILRVVGQAF